MRFMRQDIDYTKIRQFPLSPKVRAMLRRRFDINPDEAFVQTGGCRDCLALPFAERNKLAQKAIESEQSEHRRDPLRDSLNKSRN